MTQSKKKTAETAETAKTADTAETSGTPEEPGDKAGSTPAGATAAQVLRAAHEQFAELTGLLPEGISRFERSEGGGWELEAEVVELARIPETMSVMALYELSLDTDGLLTGYRRVRRYERGRTGRTDSR
ncbi:gas vesicle protein [Streptosporangium nondiastaticum]|uniref:Gas vesicle protein n=1 Tax=Streptosporangium nondiastaticum TaxID=35764 RepID=A0A9X7JUN5_9ACTN|nr:gas vesicle protein GvpO [Streptosporangium nondiastaticum]PSJ30073.1 gas vesicle protein [Streptosporangium nondiastaticum]